MEKRVLFAIVLCVGVLVGWNWIQNKFWPPPPRSASAPVAGPAVPGAQQPAPKPAGGDPAVPPPVETPEPPAGAGSAAGGAPAGELPAKSVTLETRHLHATVSSLGGGSVRALEVWGCTHHEAGDRSVPGDPGVVTSAVEGREGFLGVDVIGSGGSTLARTHWELDAGATVVRSSIARGALRITTALRPSADEAHPFHYDYEVTATGVAGARAGGACVLEIGGPWMPVAPHSVVPEDGLILAAEGESVEQLLAVDVADKLKDEPNHERRAEAGWRYVGMRSDFYLAAILPIEPLPKSTAVGFRSARVVVPVAGVATPVDTAQATLRIPFDAPSDGKSVTWKFLVYAGPDSRDVIGVEGSPYEKLGDAFPNRSFLGLSFGPIARLLGWLLSQLANTLHLGWGLAVCALTVLVRGVLFPLSRKTQISMRVHAQRMQKVKPRLDLIKEKYADNAKKQQEETMKVFREEKMSILPGGCLLAFAQMPVWISLYATLQTTFEMRHAGFLWFADLTGPDHLLEVPALRNVWLLGGLTQGWFNLLPLLMMITWFGSAAMQPLPEDPEQRAQAKMMRWYPLAFGVFLYNTAAGLTLYMTLSALWSIGETWLIKKVWLSKIEMTPAPAPASAQKR